ncbi:MAG: hypothetical protein HUN04_25350 [Desulfobacter sp.]|nr:MAG: hypothetical protein HUN04_25350 [Desulfobacter sp.]
MDTTISLLPFIESEKNGFLVDLPVSDQGDDAHPFHIQEKGQDFSFLVKAGLKVNGCAPFRPLLMLVQKDHYHVTGDPLHPMTNGELDLAWQETFDLYSSADHAFFIPDPLRPDLPPMFKPLFFCKKAHCFFQPPCPECGAPLALCTDDNTLKNAGLLPYFTSLNRYLYCVHCHDAGKPPVFYQYARSAGDPPFVRDRFGLIKDFAKLRSAKDFPCLDCPDHPECYLTGEKAGSRIGFLSFYPFYMLFFEAAAIRADDFLALLAGGGDDAPHGGDGRGGAIQAFWNRKEDGYFFKGEPRFFLEVLFLKLRFMEKVVHLLARPPMGEVKSRIELSIQSIWITLRPGGSLPFFWDFDLKIIDFISNSSQTPRAVSLGGSRNLNFITRLWFYVFLSNNIQTTKMVFQALDRLRDLQWPQEIFKDYNRLIEIVPEFDARHIFDTPDRFQVPDAYHGAWLKTLLTGAGLFGRPEGIGLGDVLQRLSEDIAHIKKEVQAELFAQKDASTPAEGDIPREEIPQPRAKETTMPEAVTEDRRAIANILKQVKLDWQAETRPRDAAPDLSADMEEEDSLETIILSSADATTIPGEDRLPLTDPEQGQATAPPERESSRSSDFDDMEKTMVIDGAPQKEPAGGEDGFDEMEKTMVLTPDSPPSEEPEFFQEEDDLEKTMIIPPKE